MVMIVAEAFLSESRFIVVTKLYAVYSAHTLVIVNARMNKLARKVVAIHCGLARQMIGNGIQISGGIVGRGQFYICL